MINTCYYCGSAAIHQFKGQLHPDGKVTTPGVWCCSTHTGRCPAIRLKNSESQKNRDPGWLDKREVTSLERFGQTHAMKQESKKKYGSENSFANPDFKITMQTRYGVTNATQLPGVGDKISKTLNEKSEEWWQERSSKQRETAYLNGTWVPESEITRLDMYRSRVQYQTELNYENHKEVINPNNVIRSRYGNYHIDHIYSIKEAFLNDVPVEIVSHPCNLRMITERENKVKNGKSDMSLEELYQRFDSSNQKTL